MAEKIVRMLENAAAQHTIVAKRKTTCIFASRFVVLALPIFPTSNGLEQIIILGHGAQRLSAENFHREVEQAEKAIREYLKQ